MFVYLKAGLLACVLLFAFPLKTVAWVTAAFRRSGISLQLREQPRLLPGSLLMWRNAQQP
jgi:hypothetical protein